MTKTKWKNFTVHTWYTRTYITHTHSSYMTHTQMMYVHTFDTYTRWFTIGREKREEVSNEPLSLRRRQRWIDNNGDGSCSCKREQRRRLGPKNMIVAMCIHAGVVTNSEDVYTHIHERKERRRSIHERGKEKIGRVVATSCLLSLSLSLSLSKSDILNHVWV